jgi:hypothetical protein
MKIAYISNMYINISFNPAAFKHGVTEDDIRWAIRTHLCDILGENHACYDR